MAGQSTAIKFAIYKGNNLLREESLAQPVIKIGKLSSSHLRLEDDSVSRMHAVVEVSGDEVSVIDLGSTKGTFVNGSKINKAKLQSGDEIVLGETRIVITIGAEASAPAPTPAAAAAPVASAPAAPVGATPAAPIPAAPAPATGSPIARPPAAAPIPAPAAMRAPIPARVAAAPAAPASGVIGAPPQFGADAGQETGGDRSIEIAAMLGDSVVGVKHVSNPRGGKVTPATKGLYAVGGGLLLLSLVSFWMGVSTASANKAAKHQWVHVDQLPAERFEASDKHTKISGMWDVLAFGGFIGGIACLTWGLIRIRSEKVSPYYVVGKGDDVDFASSSVPGDSFSLVAPFGDTFVLNYTDQMQGELYLDNQTLPLADLQSQGKSRPSSTAPGATEFEIPEKARIRVQAGPNTFLVSSVPKPRRHVPPLLPAIGGTVAVIFAGSLMFHMGFWGILQNFYDEFGGDYDGTSAAADVDISANSKADEEQEDETPESNKDDNKEEGGKGTKEKNEEGKMGKKDSKRESGRYAVKDRGAANQFATRAAAMAEARTAGVAGAIGQFSFTGEAAFDSGDDAEDVLGGRWGDEVGEMSGGFGSGQGGVGPGGGGYGTGTIGSGNYGVMGHGAGTGDGYGTGAGGGLRRGRKAGAPKLKILEATAVGDLDKSIIRRYIRRREARYKHCYERELLVRPGLKGTVTVNFTIGPSGRVLTASARGVSSGVSSCVARNIQGIKFPKPTGGGIVNVRYPFDFSASN